MPTENGFVQTFYGPLLDEWLNVHWLDTSDGTEVTIEACRVEYNESRPDQGLNDLTPMEYARIMATGMMIPGSIKAGSAACRWHEEPEPFIGVILARFSWSETHTTWHRR